MKNMISPEYRQYLYKKNQLKIQIERPLPSKIRKVLFGDKTILVESYSSKKVNGFTIHRATLLIKNGKFHRNMVNVISLNLIGKTASKIHHTYSHPDYPRDVLIQWTTK